MPDETPPRSRKIVHETSLDNPRLSVKGVTIPAGGKISQEGDKIEVSGVVMTPGSSIKFDTMPSGPCEPTTMPAGGGTPEIVPPSSSAAQIAAVNVMAPPIAIVAQPPTAPEGVCVGPCSRPVGVGVDELPFIHDGQTWCARCFCDSPANQDFHLTPVKCVNCDLVSINRVGDRCTRCTHNCRLPARALPVVSSR